MKADPNKIPDKVRPYTQTAHAAIPEPSCPSPLSLKPTIKAIIIVSNNTAIDERDKIEPIPKFGFTLNSRLHLGHVKAP